MATSLWGENTMKKAVISIFFLGIVMLFGYVLIVYPTPIIDHVQHYGLFNYKMYSDISFSNSYCAIEPHVFAYEFHAPYMYTYGVSGYCKTNVFIFGGVEKIPNLAYDAQQENDSTGMFSTSINMLENYYGSRLSLKKSVRNASVKDEKIYKKLQKIGEKNKNAYFNNIKKKNMKNFIKVERNLVEITK